MGHLACDEWFTKYHVSSAGCVKQKGSSGTLRRHVATYNWVGIQSRWIKG